MTETPASEIPIDKLKLPKGFKVEIWATGLPGARAMTMNDDQTQDLRRHARHRPRLRSHRRRRQAHHQVLVDKLTQPSGVAFANGALYVFAIDKVLRYDGIAKGAATASRST